VSIFFRNPPMSGASVHNVCASAVLTADLWGVVLSYLPWVSHFSLRDTSQELCAAVGERLNRVTDLLLVDDFDLFVSRGLIAFAHLRTLRLRNLRGVTGPRLAEFALRLPHTIDCLDLSSCVGVTDEVESLVSGPLVTSLRSLDVTFTSATHALVLRLYARCPNLFIRRIPEWLVGHREWIGGVMTYFPDGSVAFSMHAHTSPGLVLAIEDLGTDIAYCVQSMTANDDVVCAFFRARPLARGRVLLASAPWNGELPVPFPADMEAHVASMVDGEAIIVLTAQGELGVTKLRVTPLSDEAIRPPPPLLAEISAYYDAHP